MRGDKKRAIEVLLRSGSTLAECVAAGFERSMVTKTAASLGLTPSDYKPRGPCGPSPNYGRSGDSRFGEACSSKSIQPKSLVTEDEITRIYELSYIRNGYLYEDYPRACRKPMHSLPASSPYKFQGSVTGNAAELCTGA